jgi:hypothetical protein
LLFGGVSEAASPEIDAVKREMEQIRREYERRIRELQQRIEALEKAREAPPPPEAVAPAAPPTAVGAPARATLSPDLSVIGDMAAGYSRLRDAEGKRFRANVREVEIGFQAAVDPYARADFFIAVEREEGEFKVDLEEGYVTLLNLPWGLQLKGGKFNASFGKVNRIHRPERYYADAPLVVPHFLGGEGRLAGTGVSLSRLIPNPWGHYIEATGEVFFGDEEALVGGRGVREPNYLGRLRYYLDLTEASSLDIGGSFLRGVHDPERRWTTLAGLDFTYRWRPPREGQYRSFLWQSEALINRRQEGEGASASSWGGYTFARYQWDRRWYAGLRLDYAERPEERKHRSWMLTPLVEFWPSEFHRLRLQYSHLGQNFGEFRRDDRFTLQWTVTLGPHRPEPF